MTSEPTTIEAKNESTDGREDGADDIDPRRRELWLLFTHIVASVLSGKNRRKY